MNVHYIQALAKRVHTTPIKLVSASQISLCFAVSNQFLLYFSFAAAPAVMRLTSTGNDCSTEAEERINQGKNGGFTKCNLGSVNSQTLVVRKLETQAPGKRF